MKATKDRLSYWKGRKLDAQSGCKQAQEHYRLMLKCVLHAMKRVNQLERQILLIALLFAVGFAHGCGTVRGVGALMTGIGSDLKRAAGGYDAKKIEEPRKENKL